MKALLSLIAALAALSSHAFGEVAVRAERVELARPGDHVIVTLGFNDPSGAFLSGGFDFTVKYDSNLVFAGAQPGQILNLCHWEYFNYTSPALNVVHVMAIADVNNGDVHPYCYGAPVADLADLVFDIPLDYSLYGRYLPVRFIWYDCGDNALSSRYGDTLYMSDQVFHFDGYREYEITRDTAFPSYFGAPSWCVNVDGSRILDFYSGGVSLIQEDVIPPVAQCPGDTTVNSAPGQCGATVEFTAAVTDNRAGATIACEPPSGSLFPVGATVVRCTAEDYAGNTDTCSFTVTVRDIEPPVLNCPNDTAIANSPNQCLAIFNYSVDAADNCGPVSVASSRSSGSVFYIGTTDVIVTAVDPAGNSAIDTFSVTVEDRQFPVASYPAAVTVSNAPGVCGAWVTYSASVSDNCPGATLDILPPSGTLFPVGTTPVRVIAVDALGNADTGYFPVTVIDTQPPVLAVPDTMFVAAGSGLCAATVTFDLAAVDNCTLASLTTTPPSGAAFPIGSSAVIAIAADAAGNADTAQFVLVVRDLEAPVIDRPEDLTVPADPGQCAAVVSFTPTASDNCGEVSLSTDPASGAAFPVGVTAVEVIAVDPAGNADTASFTVTVLDLEPPAVLCPDDMSLSASPGSCTAPAFFTAAAADNCGEPAILSSPAPGSTFPVGATPVTLIAVDQSGNADTCTFTVTVLDTEPPCVACPPDIFVVNDSGRHDAVVWFTVDGSDNCALAASGASIPSGSIFPLGATPVDAWVTDPSGLADTCRFTVTVTLDDPDGDQLASWEDNCPDTANPAQRDTDGDGVGDACCCVVRGDADGRGELGSEIGITDLTFLVGFLMQGGAAPPCPAQANVNGSPATDDDPGISITDLVYLVNFLFRSQSPPPPCN